MTKPASNGANPHTRVRDIPRSASASEPNLSLSEELGDASRYVAITTPDGWQLLLELGPRYLRWLMRGALGNEGQALPDADVSAESLEAENGTLHKPALEREGVEIGSYRNARKRDGELVPLGECLEDGVFELVFDGPVMGGLWRLSRSGSPRRQPENWTLLRAMGNRLARRYPLE